MSHMINSHSDTDFISLSVTESNIRYSRLIFNDNKVKLLINITTFINSFCPLYKSNLVSSASLSRKVQTIKHLFVTSPNVDQF